MDHSPTSSSQIVQTTGQSQLCTTTCPYCGVGCGVEVTKTKQITAISEQVSLGNLKGRSDHPANFGRLCVKGSNLLETNDISGRLLHPSVNNKKASWENAVATVADKFKAIIAEHGSDSVAFYVSGQLLTEDYYVANKLMKGYIGSANIDTNSRLCMSSAVAAYKRAFGSDTVPCNYEDLEQTEYLVMVGSNAAWTHPVLFQRIERAKQLNPNMKVVVIDPRKTNTCEIADQFLQIQPGTDAYLFNGLLSYLNEGEYLDDDFISDHTEHFSQALAEAAQLSFSEIADKCQIDYTDLLDFYEGFAKATSSITFYSMGINQSTSGVDKANAIINCHLASGKIGKQGSGPFSITGQPNAMGGREVGGLANMLAAHMDIPNPAHRSLVQDFWQSPAIPTENGHKAVDMFDAIERGDIKAIWVMATNPVVSMPNRDRIEAALAKCEFVVVSDVVEKNDTIAFADVLFPATAWSEKDGTVTNSERRISRQQALMPAPGSTKHDWQIMCDVAKAMGFEEGFNFTHPSQVFDEHARLSAFKNDGSRDFDISGLIGLSVQQYDRLQPIQWPVNAEYPSGRARMFTDKRYFTPSKKAQFIAITPRAPTQQTTDAFPIVLNSGRLRDQWHTMTRTGKAAKLSEHISEPFIAINARTAKSLSLNREQLVSLSAQHTDTPVLLKVKIDDGVANQHAFAPIHWGKTNTRSSGIASLYNGANDPISGQPELKHAAISIAAWEHHTQAILFCRAELPSLFLATLEYWTVSVIDGGFAYTLASSQGLTEFMTHVDGYLVQDSEVFRLQSHDSQQLISTSEDSLSLAVFAAKVKENQAVTYINQVSSTWLSALLNSQALTSSEISSLLRIEPDEVFTQGNLVCSCFSVREKTIASAIEQGCDSVEALGKKLKCGTNCGSCKTELKAMINQHTAIAVVEI